MNTVERFIAEGILQGRRTISGTDSLFSGGILDSMNLVELIGFLESSYGVHITPSEVCLENLDSLERITQFIDRKRGQG